MPWLKDFLCLHSSFTRIGRQSSLSPSPSPSSPSDNDIWLRSTMKRLCIWKWFFFSFDWHEIENIYDGAIFLVARPICGFCVYDLKYIDLILCGWRGSDRQDVLNTSINVIGNSAHEFDISIWGIYFELRWLLLKRAISTKVHRQLWRKQNDLWFIVSVTNKLKLFSFMRSMKSLKHSKIKYLRIWWFLHLFTHSDEQSEIWMVCGIMRFGAPTGKINSSKFIVLSLLSMEVHEAIFPSVS